MLDYHVVAWNCCDEDGRPIIEVDRDMSREEYHQTVDGRYRCQSVRVLQPISREFIDRALASGRLKSLTADILDDWYGMTATEIIDDGQPGSIDTGLLNADGKRIFRRPRRQPIGFDLSGKD